MQILTIKLHFRFQISPSKPILGRLRTEEAHLDRAKNLQTEGKISDVNDFEILITDFI